MTNETASLYLSRLILNPRSRQVMRELAHPYEMHRTMMRAFPKAEDDEKGKVREKFGVLFRVETNERRHAVLVYVQSLIEPDWSLLNEQHDYLGTNMGEPAYEHKDIMPIYRNIQNEQVFSFRLRANPTKRVIKNDDPMKGKRVELFREDEQVAWLTRKGAEREKGVSGGFELLTRKVEDRLVPRINVHAEGKQTGRKKDAARGHVTTHLAVLFDGLLRVTDAAAFRDTIIRGVGSGKAFGFGLLSVAPPASVPKERA